MNNSANGDDDEDEDVAVEVAAPAAVAVPEVSPPEARAVDDANGFAMNRIRSCDSEEEDDDSVCLLMKAKLRLKSS